MDTLTGMCRYTTWIAVCWCMIINTIVKVSRVSAIINHWKGISICKVVNMLHVKEWNFTRTSICPPFITQVKLVLWPGVGHELTDKHIRSEYVLRFSDLKWYVPCEWSLNVIVCLSYTKERTSKYLNIASIQKGMCWHLNSMRKSLSWRVIFYEHWETMMKLLH